MASPPPSRFRPTTLLTDSDNEGVSMTIEERIKRIEGRLNKTTNGEWVDDNGYRVRLGGQEGEVIVETKHSAVATCWDNEFIAHSKDDITFLLSELKRCREALDGLIDDDDCRFDHHGYCQTHFSGSSPCVMETARKALHPEGVK